MSAVRPCLGCAKYDSDPRHVLTTPDGAELAMHMDCCAMARDCDVCHEQIVGAKGAKGEALRAHLITTGSAPGQPGWTAPADDAQEG